MDLVTKLFLPGSELLTQQVITLQDNDLLFQEFSDMVNAQDSEAFTADQKAQ